MKRPPFFDTLRYFQDLVVVEKTTNRLPHWQQEGATYFVTFRLADSIPIELQENLRFAKEKWMTENPKPWSVSKEKEYHLKFSAEIDRFMDQGLGDCWLRSSKFAKVVAESILYFDHDRYLIHSFVIMPNHVHLMVTLLEESTLEVIVKSWKQFSATKINKTRGVSGAFWQKSYFDRIIRDREHLWNVIRYIRRNPQKAKLKEGEFIHYEAEHLKGGD